MMIGKIQNVSFKGLTIDNSPETNKALAELGRGMDDPSEKMEDLFKDLDKASGNRYLVLKGKIDRNFPCSGDYAVSLDISEEDYYAPLNRTSFINDNIYGFLDNLYNDDGIYQKLKEFTEFVSRTCKGER